MPVALDASDESASSAHSDPIGPQLRTPQAVAAYCNDLALLPHEVLIALVIDSSHHLRVRVHIDGHPHGVAARPCELLRPVLVSGCSALIVVHNHPSGSPRPSATDIAYTQRLADACRLLGVALVDHVIVASTGWTSFAQLGWLPTSRSSGDRVQW